MPYFQPHYDLHITSIIDCIIENPSNILAKACTWSQYTTWLVLHHKASSVLSQMDGVEGSLTSTYLSFPALSKLLPGDVILADCGFHIHVSDSVTLKGATHDLPAFTWGCEQLSPSQVEDTRKIANVRIHVERNIGVLHQQFQVLSATEVLQKELISHTTTCTHNTVCDYYNMKCKSTHWNDCYSRGAVLETIAGTCCALKKVLYH